MGERITLQNLIDLFIKKSNLLKNEGDFFVRSFFVLIEKGLAKDGYVKIKGLGSFKLVKVEDRESVNVNTGERFLIEGHTKISFVPDVGLRELINKPFGHFETVILNDGVEFDDLSLEEEVTVKTIGSGKVQPEIEAIQVVEFRDEENETSQTKQEAVVEKEEKKEEPVEKRFEDNSGIEESSFAFTEKESVSIVEEHKNKEEFQDTGSVDLPEIVPPEKRRGVWIIPFILIVIGGIAALFFFVDLNMDTHKSSPSVYLLADSVFPESTANASETVIPIPDTISLDPDAMEDKLEVVVTAPVTTVSNSPVIENKRYAENKKYTISGTKAIHTVKQGERLTVIALQYYGTKKLWPYIVEHNKGVITNPDVVPYGTVIKIPELK